MRESLSRASERLNAAPALLLTLTALFWGGNAIAGQLAVGEVGPFTLTFLRWALVSAVLWTLYGAEVRAVWPEVRPRMPRIVLMASLGFTAFNALFYVASHQTSAVNIGILQGSIPIFVLIGAFFAYGSRVGALQAVGVLATILGVVLVATRGAPDQILSLGVNPGDALMLLACALYASYTVMLRSRPAISGRAFFTLMAPIAAVTALPLMLFEAGSPGYRAPTMTGWLVTLFVAVFPSCLSQLFFMRGVDLIGPGRAGVFVNLVPVFAALLAVALLGQAFAWFHAVALALVLGGIWLAQRGAAPEAVPAIRRSS
ncbi:DMT family transporter [Limibaculum sp. M0105]|uniref:DMT family transporter n=1 Tax=Thermohalobaculum xanthum TaxID=2753746 RepID=A0A8J7SBV4_9RHOB|nr:DMT family transporter [Thermohalobaculum xanthum]MBK0399137.1 DMT family transporter [Thermohalobaculum xanthum]